MFDLEIGVNIQFKYINWEGLTSHRRVLPIAVMFGTTEYHKESQWLLKGLDLHKNEVRIFAMNDMTDVERC